MCFFVTKAELLDMVNKGHVHPVNFNEIMEEIRALDPNLLLSVRGEYYREDSCDINISTLDPDEETCRYMVSSLNSGLWAKCS